MGSSVIIRALLAGTAALALTFPAAAQSRIGHYPSWRAGVKVPVVSGGGGGGSTPVLASASGARNSAGSGTVGTWSITTPTLNIGDLLIFGVLGSGNSITTSGIDSSAVCPTGMSLLDTYSMNSVNLQVAAYCYVFITAPNQATYSNVSLASGSYTQTNRGSLVAVWQVTGATTIRSHTMTEVGNPNASSLNCPTGGAQTSASGDLILSVMSNWYGTANNQVRGPSSAVPAYTIIPSVAIATTYTDFRTSSGTTIPSYTYTLTNISGGGADGGSCEVMSIH